jgi:hypothetical protein
MKNYEDMSPEAKRISESADLFGEGGKRHNAEFAAVILRSAAEVLRNAYANEEYPDHPDEFLFDIANEFDPPMEPTKENLGDKSKAIVDLLEGSSIRLMNVSEIKSGNSVLGSLSLEEACRPQKDNKPTALYFELEDGSKIQTALFDGYPVGDRLLENVMFIVTVNGGKLDVKIHPDDKDYFSNLNESYWLKKVADYVQDYDIFEHPETGEDVYLITDQGSHV